MTERSTVALVALVAAITVAGAGLVAGTTGSQTAQSVDVDSAQVTSNETAPNATNETAETPTAPETMATEPFTIVSVSAPESAAPGETADVVALVENSGAEDAQAVEFRLEGDVIDRQRVAIESGEVEPVAFELNTTGVDPGEYVHSIFTEADGVSATVNVTESFVVDELSAPENVAAGDNITVEATVTNPGEIETTQTVTFRLAGAPVSAERVTLDEDESAEIAFEIDSTGVEPGTYTHGVFTRDAGELASIEVQAAPEEAETDDEADETGASVEFTSQSSDGTSVVVDSVTAPEGGFVVIHDASLLEGEVIGSVIGVSEPLEPGTTEDVTVELFDVPGAEFNESSLGASETLIAMPHLDTNDNDVYDFVTSEGAEDGPYVADGEAVTSQALISVSGETGADTTEEPENGATAGEQPDNETDGTTDGMTDDNETDGMTDGNETDSETMSPDA